MRSSESETESPSETPRSDSTVRTKSELEAIESTTQSNSEYGAGGEGDSDECLRDRVRAKPATRGSCRE